MKALRRERKDIETLWWHADRMLELCVSTSRGKAAIGVTYSNVDFVRTPIDFFHEADGSKAQ
jgi:hypothetical protein